ncbi:MAG: hypothetical protein ACXADH_16310 [Candidatus Kariarchaeaceae archaeon]
MENVTYFHNQTQKFEKKDINQYDTINEFKSKVVEAKQNLSKGEIKKSAKKIFENDRHLVVQPLTHAASCFYGAGTQWCTTSRNYPTHYLSYTKRGTLFYYINKRNGKKRAFFTPFREPFLRPETVGGTVHDRLGHTQVYTETDNRGRSLRGIPTEARQAMDAEHKKGFEKYIEALPMREKIEFMIDRGMELPESFNVYEGNWRFNIEPPKQIKKIVGNFKENGYGFGEIKEVTGNVELYYRSERGFGNLEVIGGDLRVVGAWSWSTANYEGESIGNLKKVGGTFPWNKLLNVSVEGLSGLQEVGKITLTREQASQIREDVKIPGLPNTKVSM